HRRGTPGLLLLLVGAAAGPLCESIVRRDERAASEHKLCRDQGQENLAQRSLLNTLHLDRGRLLLENERNTVPDARDLDRLAVDHARLVLELRRGIDRGAIEQAARRLDNDDILRRAGTRDRELDDHVSLETSRGSPRRIDRGDLHDRQILAIADADTEAADFDVRRE